MIPGVSGLGFGVAVSRCNIGLLLILMGLRSFRFRDLRVVVQRCYDVDWVVELSI